MKANQHRTTAVCLLGCSAEKQHIHLAAVICNSEGSAYDIVQKMIQDPCPFVLLQ